MAYTIKKDIVVPNGYVSRNSCYTKPFRQVHAHSSGNANSSVQNELDYLAGHYSSANYNFLVGITNGQVDIRQVMDTNQGAWDVGGDWNAETYGAIEFVEGSIRSQADFNKAYPAYIWLARTLNKQAGNSDYTLDTSNTAGIKTHNYASATGHGSDHTDPIAFLAKWGISYNQLKHDIKYGLEKEATPEMQANIKGAHYKQGAKVKAVSGGQSTYGNKFSKNVLGTWGKVSAVRPINASEKKKFKHSGYSYLVAWHYNNDITFWNIPGEYLKDFK